jgi:hypothetical protein
VTRLFKIKLDHLIKELKKGDVFGKVKSGNYLCNIIFCSIICLCFLLHSNVVRNLSRYYP